MGDVVHALPLAVDIAEAVPAAQIDWLCEEAFAAIPAMSRYIGAVHKVALRRWRKRPFDPSVWREVRIAKSALRDAHYDLVLDVQGLAKSAWLARWTAAPVTGFDSSTAREAIAAQFYQHQFEVPRSLHAIERCRRLGAAALGYTVTSCATLRHCLERSAIEQRLAGSGVARQRQPRNEVVVRGVLGCRRALVV